MNPIVKRAIPGGALALIVVGLRRRSGTPSPDPERTQAPAAQPPLIDAALARKVESMIFRADDAPKGAVSVNAFGPIVELRGELDEGAITEVVRAAEGVEGVTEVHSYLHTPGTPAPNVAASRAAG
jgi:hypothetical protein